MRKPLSISIEKQGDAWPELHWTAWKDTAATLHLWMQIIGKIRLALAAHQNHWWQATFYTTSQGLTTSPMPYGNRILQIDFDFLSHQLIFQTDDGMQERLALAPMSVANFFQQVMEKMNTLEMPVSIYPVPTEIADPIPFASDQQHAAYDASAVTKFWKILLQTDRVINQFRSRFVGKASPAHVFWGGCDLAYTRFSGRRAPRHGSVPYTPDYVVQSAYSHEVSSCGFWPGGPSLPEPVFYAYAYPAPKGYSKAKVQPEQAYFHTAMGEFILPYQAVQQSADPDQTLLSFLQSTYEAAANLGQWNRQELEAMFGS